MLGARNSSRKSELFTRRRHEKLDFYYSTQSNFGLPRQSFRNNSDRIKLFKQSLRDVESLFRDIGAYDMEYRKLKQMRRED